MGSSKALVGAGPGLAELCHLDWRIPGSGDRVAQDTVSPAGRRPIHAGRLAGESVLVFWLSVVDEERTSISSE
jgi:hypothetical protein